MGQLIDGLRGVGRWCIATGVTVAIAFSIAALLVPLLHMELPDPMAGWIAAAITVAVTPVATRMIFRALGVETRPTPRKMLAIWRDGRARIPASLVQPRGAARGWSYALIAGLLAPIVYGASVALAVAGVESANITLPGILHEPWASLIPLVRDAAGYDLPPTPSGFTAVQSMGALAWWSVAACTTILPLYVRSDRTRLKAVLALRPGAHDGRAPAPFLALLGALIAAALPLLVWGPAAIGITTVIDALILIAFAAFIVNAAIAGAVIIPQ